MTSKCYVDTLPTELPVHCKHHETRSPVSSFEIQQSHFLRSTINKIQSGYSKATVRCKVSTVSALNLSRGAVVEKTSSY